MMTPKRWILAVVGGLVLLAGLLYGPPVLYRQIAPAWRSAERQVWEQTPSYVQGKTQIIEKCLREIRTASNTDRAALRTEVLNEAATVDRNALPARVRNELAALETER